MNKRTLHHQRKIQNEIGGGIAKENGYRPVLSGRRQSFGVWGDGTVSVADVQDGTQQLVGWRLIG